MADGSKKVLLVVTGGIAAYKAPGLIALLKEGGATVRVAMTHAATHFIGAPSLEVASGERVLVDLFADDQQGIDHVSWGQWADLLLVAPATANFLAKMAHGLADDAASTLVLATRAPILLAPAMNDAMWEHPATRANVATLGERGAQLVGPAEGALAEGYSAVGRMSDPSEIARAALALL